MSKISLKPADTGTATFTLEAPSTNTNRTLTLPDEAGTVALLSDIPTPPTNRTFSTSFVSVDFNSSSSYAKKSCFDTTPAVNKSGFSVTSSDITIPEDGYYFIAWNIKFTSGGSRPNVEVALGVNDSVNETLYASHSYIRNTDGHDTSSSNASGIVFLSANDTVHIYSKRETDITNSVNSQAGVGSFNIYKIHG